MATLEQLYLRHPDSPAYRHARQKAIKRCAAHIRPYLRPGVDPATLAASMYEVAEAMGRIHANTFDGEVPSYLTLAHTPFAFTV